MTQKDRVLQILKSNKAVSNYQLRERQYEVGFQFPVRIHELIQEGHPIISYRDPQDRRKWWYEYKQIQQDLFAA
jgi:hypothetical protein